VNGRRTGERPIARFDPSATRTARWAVVLFRLDISDRSSLSGHSLRLRARAGRTGFPFDFEHWCRRQTRCEQPAHDPTAPSALADPGLVLVKGPDRPDL
jgi:hypothetical protein